jgi:hypothetical protein
MHAQLPGLLQEQVRLLFWQFSQRLPARVPVAQARSDVPAMHEPVALQQPMGQLLALHAPEPLLLPPDPLPLPVLLLLLPLPLLLLVLLVHTPWRHRSPVAVQSTHAAPMLPHWVLDVAVTHVVPLQQPAQELGPHAPPLPLPEPVQPSPVDPSPLLASPPSPA